MTQDRNLLIKKLLHQTLSEQVEKMKENEDPDQSFIYLEGESMHLLLMYLLLGLEDKVNDQGVTPQPAQEIEEVEPLNEQLNRIHEKINKAIQEHTNPN
ncbi:hypothetical protein [Piscibacillus halophilus]|uniref:hypothetical protein n=1 Tax=Piscibacillus halophilus TaxID=571933 RepID=UPI00240A69C9|nr:hypothetical protein [Piscibacillus halophilus]